MEYPPVPPVQDGQARAEALIRRYSGKDYADMDIGALAKAAASYKIHADSLRATLDEIPKKEIADELGLEIGDSIGKSILPGIKRLKDRMAKLEAERNAAVRVLQLARDEFTDQMVKVASILKDAQTVISDRIGGHPPRSRGGGGGVTLLFIMLIFAAVIAAFLSEDR